MVVSLYRFAAGRPKMQLVTRMAALFAGSLTNRDRSDYVHHHFGAVRILAGLCVSSVHVVESLAEIANVCGVSPYSSKSGNARRTP
jgi:hypothetical protein